MGRENIRRKSLRSFRHCHSDLVCKELSIEKRKACLEANCHVVAAKKEIKSSTYAFATIKNAFRKVFFSTIFICHGEDSTEVDLLMSSL